MSWRAAAFGVVSLALMGALAETVAANQDYWGTNNRIIYTSVRGGEGDILTMKPNGKGKRLITDNAIPETDAVYSPDAKRIAFVRSDGNDGEIWVMRANGKRKRQITDNDAGDFGPVWSPSGKHLVYSSNRENPVNIDLYSQRARPGAAAKQLTEGDSFASGPTFSPNGKRIAFRAQRGPSAEIYMMRRDGSNEQNLTNTMSINEFGPAWSPNGKLIAYTLQTGPEQQIATLRVKTGAFVETLSEGDSDFPAGWSPDGKWIVFGSFRDGTNGEIYKMKANGRRERNLTQNAIGDFFLD
jgi:Tol biopolymer transport system component